MLCLCGFCTIVVPFALAQRRYVSKLPGVCPQAGRLSASFIRPPQVELEALQQAGLTCDNRCSREGKS
jgi:hypothetical protein